MGKETKIEWCDSTVNPTDFQCCGCELWNKNVKDCYAGRFAERRAGKGAFDKPVVLKPGRMAQASAWSDLRGTDRPDKPWLNGRPRVIFIGDMADTLQPGIHFSYLQREIIDVVNSQAGQRHVWMWLTKQAHALVTFQLWLAERGHAWPENLWPGVSVLNERGTWRVDALVKIQSANRFISYEPAWEYVDFSRWTSVPFRTGDDKEDHPSHKIALIITGGQSGSKLGSNCITDNANMHDSCCSRFFNRHARCSWTANLFLSDLAGTVELWILRQLPCGIHERRQSFEYVHAKASCREGSTISAARSAAVFTPERISVSRPAT